MAPIGETKILILGGYVGGNDGGHESGYKSDGYIFDISSKKVSRAFDKQGLGFGFRSRSNQTATSKPKEVTALVRDSKFQVRMVSYDLEQKKLKTLKSFGYEED